MTEEFCYFDGNEMVQVADVSTPSSPTWVINPEWENANRNLKFIGLVDDIITIDLPLFVEWKEELESRAFDRMFILEDGKCRLNGTPETVRNLNSAASLAEEEPRGDYRSNANYDAAYSEPPF